MFHISARRRTASGRLGALTGLLVLATVVAGLVSGSTAATAGPTSPLAGGRWGVYTGSADGIYPAWQQASGSHADLLAKMALRPRVRWMGSWIPDNQIASKMHDYIDQTQAGDPSVLVQMAIFREFPTGEGHRSDPLTTADQASYRTWIDNAARAIGPARVAMVLEPDLAVGLKGWKPAVRQKLVTYAARKFGALPNTSVYLDASDADWLKVPDAVTLLLHSGIRYVRGFALGATHYNSTAANDLYGKQLVAALAKAGVPGRHFVVDTADNGKPFTWLQYYAAHPKGDFDNAQTCQTLSQTRCVTLGIPPTSDVASTRWHLGSAARAAAGTYCDAYLWFGRPWLYRQASPFKLQRALDVGRTTPF